MRRLNSLPSREAGFVEPMECLSVSKLPNGPEWVYEIKFDGYRALAINANGKLSLYSRKRKSFSRQYQHVFDALCDLPQNTVVDGEIVALDDAGRPNFNFLQHSRSQAKRIHYFVFDLLIYDNRNLTQLPLVERCIWVRPELVARIEYLEWTLCFTRMLLDDVPGVLIDT